MERITLNGLWTLAPKDGGKKIPAQVPGSVYSAMIASGEMGDPYWRDNETKFFDLMENDFTFSRSFRLDGAFLDHEKILLACEGLDTLCDIFLNGRPVGKADNMHRQWRFDAKPFLREGENEIRAEFSSPLKYIREKYAEAPADGSAECTVGFPHLRKAHCMLGWDWGPRLPDAGIWRDIGLEGCNGARLTGAHCLQRHEDGKVFLTVIPEAEVFDSGTKAEFRVEVKGPDGSVWKAEGPEATLEIDHPQLWWPNGYGDQPLYTVTAVLLCGGAEQDRWTRRIGLRTMEIHREKDQWGECFAHRVNGVDIFAMGADYIPEDNILSRITPERTKELLTAAAQSHFNAIRVWGGGFYPNDFFYDLCDELGLIVWQDFMFACAVYNLTEPFEENITAELTDNIRRVRHHACLGLWCGNNEMEMFVDRNRWVSSHRQKADYIKMYEYLFPKLLKRLDPQTVYWPASPSSGGSFDDPNDENRGDVHYWDVWHGDKPFTEYQKFFFRYVSEFGFQSFPCEKTIQAFTLPEDRNIFSYVMEKHQRNNAANGKILNYLSQTFLYPNSFSGLVYASQLLQAEAIRCGVEHWRRNRGRCMGTIYWQLNDCWPVASWASIDYFGRWKALQYYAKRFFAPVLLSCKMTAALLRDPCVNRETSPKEKRAELSVANESREDFSGTVRWALKNAEGKTLRGGELTAEVPALESKWILELDLTEADTFGQYLEYTLLSAQGDVISTATSLFCPPKFFRFEDPQLTCERKGDTVTVSAAAYAKSVEIDFDGDVLLSDNYFDMAPGSRTVKVLRGDPESPRVRSVYDIR